MLVLSSRKVVLPLIWILCGIAGSLPAQTSHYFDYRPFNLGFTMGMCVAHYDMTAQINQFDEATGRVVARVEQIPKPGVYLGLITNLKLGEYFDLRFMPSVSLEERDFLFYFDSTTTTQDPVVRKKIESSNLNLPLAIKFKSDFHRNTRVWIMFGIQPSWNLASSKKVRNDPDLLKVQNFDNSVLASVGIDLYGEKLKLSPEIRFTRGLSNIYVPDRTRFPRAISDLFSQLLVFNINFE
jgi:hypothetical protein